MLETGYGKRMGDLHIAVPGAAGGFGGCWLLAFGAGADTSVTVWFPAEMSRL
jgi:hypothetical protein